MRRTPEPDFSEAVKMAESSVYDLIIDSNSEDEAVAGAALDELATRRRLERGL
jgi:hypothetical protein